MHEKIRWITFTSHNIRLDDGTYTKPEAGPSIDRLSWFLGAKRIIDATFPGDKARLSVADLGCLEGGYTVEFARLGLQSLGLDVRESNIEVCRYVQSKTDLPNLRFVRDDVWNIADHGSFDIVFCCGLLYHLDRPRAFLDVLSDVTKRLLILQDPFLRSWRFSRLHTPEATTSSCLPDYPSKEYGNDNSQAFASYSS